MIITWILSIIFAVLFLMNIKVFFFQRTIRKIHLKTGVPQRELNAAYPASYITMYRISILRFVVIAALFFVNWKVALIIVVVNFLLPAILPEQDDYKNIQIARKTISDKINYSKNADIDRLVEIDSILNSISENNFS